MNGMGKERRPGVKLTLYDAVNVALGSIIGAGIFVIIGSAAGLAGPALILSILIAAGVATLTGLTTADLSRLYPTSGGAYTFAKEALSDSAGFIVGWVWLFSNIAIGATVALGFGSYLAFFMPGINVNIGAVGIIVAVTAVNMMGAKESSTVTNILVAIKILILLFFILSVATVVKSENFIPFMPLGAGGVLAGAATIFFAYSGFARVAVIADDIAEPEKNVPKATIISIVVSTIIYFLVAVAGIGAVGYLALSKSGSPLADAMVSSGIGFGADLVGFGALIATATVALASIWGLSRIAQAMAKNNDLPGFFSRLDNKRQVPKNAIIASGALMIVFAWFLNLQDVAYISSFSLLLYYSAINLSGIRKLAGTKKAIAIGGLASCFILTLNLPVQSWMIGLGAVFAGLAYYITLKSYSPGLSHLS